MVENILTPFEGRDLMELSYVLGMEVIRDRFKRTITITHRYIILSPHNVGFCAVRLKSVHNYLAHIS